MKTNSDGSMRHTKKQRLYLQASALIVAPRSEMKRGGVMPIAEKTTKCGIENTLDCKQCKAVLDRKLFRKKGGGVHSLCPKCRKKKYNDRARIKKRMVLRKEQYALAVAEEVKMIRAARLTHEYKDAIRNNSVRLKALHSNEKPTKATEKYLAVRTYLHEVWTDAYNELLVRIESGNAVPSLSEYMEGRQCLKDLPTS